MSISATGRDQNVRGATTDSKHAPPKTVQVMVEMKMYAGEIGDENGVKQRVLAFRVGNTWYHDPAAQPWFDRLRGLAGDSWLAKALEEKYQNENTPTKAPSKDTVDIMGGPAVKT